MKDDEQQSLFGNGSVIDVYHAKEYEADKFVTHHLKLNEQFCNDVLSGKKSFEIRLNDRNYQVGDHVIFHAVHSIDEDGVVWFANHEINDKEYEITYILSGWGLKDGYVAFTVKEIKNGR